MYIYAVAIFGILVFSSFTPIVNAQNRGINMYEICKNPILDMAIVELCSTFTTNGMYTLTPKDKRVLACIGGGAVAILAVHPESLALKNQVGSGTGSQGSSGIGSDSFGGLIGGLFG